MLLVEISQKLPVLLVPDVEAENEKAVSDLWHYVYLSEHMTPPFNLFNKKTFIHIWDEGKLRGTTRGYGVVNAQSISKK
jgi:hypothetical protein